MCCSQARAAGWGASGGERGLRRGSCREGTSCPAERRQRRHRPQRRDQMALSPPAPMRGWDAGSGAGSTPRGFLALPRGCSIRGEGCVGGAAPHGGFRSVRMLQGVTGECCRCVAGETKRGHPCPAVRGGASLLPSPTASRGGRYRPGSNLVSQQGCGWVCVLPRAFLNQGWCLGWC